MLTLLDVPTPLGLRPPAPGVVPGTGQAPAALRRAGLHEHFLRQGAREAAAVTPGPYRDDADPAAHRVRNQDALLAHAHALAQSVGALLDAGETPLLVGGDCSLLLGVGVALKRRGRYGLIHLDGHSDFRNPSNSAHCASVAGEDLAAVVGKHWPSVANIDGLGPYFRPQDAAHAGCRDDDAGLEEIRGALAAALPASTLLREGVTPSAQRLHAAVSRAPQGFWLHLDVDIADPSWLSAVDSPDPGGLSARQLTELLAALAPHAVGVNVCIYDPTLDVHGVQAKHLVEVLVNGLGALGSPP